MKNRKRSAKATAQATVAGLRTDVEFLMAEISTGIALAQAASAECNENNKEYADKLLSKAKRAYDHASRGLVEMHATLTDASPLTQSLKALRSLLDEVSRLVEARRSLRFGFRQALRS